MNKLFFIIPLLIVGCSKPEVKTEQVKLPSVIASSSNELDDAGSVVQNKNDGPCPNDMVYIDGSYCSSVFHHCIKGGKDHLYNKVGDPEPYYCDEYKEENIKCLGTEYPIKYCMDKYELPNVVGEMPLVMISWYDAKNICESKGKRLCSDKEFIVACEGPQHQPSAFGWKRDRENCHIDTQWIQPNNGILAGNDQNKIDEEINRISRREPVGNRPNCVSPYGVFDLNSNVDEWYVNTLHAHEKGYFQSVFFGGHHISGARNHCRTATYSHNEITKYYVESGRCCKNVE